MQRIPRYVLRHRDHHERARRAGTQRLELVTTTRYLYGDTSMAFDDDKSPDCGAVQPRWRAIALGGLAVLAGVALMLSLVRI